MRTRETSRAIWALNEARHDIARNRNGLLVRRRQVMDTWEAATTPEERRDHSRTYQELFETTEALWDTLKALDTQLAILKKDVDA